MLVREATIGKTGSRLTVGDVDGVQRESVERSGNVGEVMMKCQLERAQDAALPHVGHEGDNRKRACRTVVHDHSRSLRENAPAARHDLDVLVLGQLAGEHQELVQPQQRLQLRGSRGIDGSGGAVEFDRGTERCAG